MIDDDYEELRHSIISDGSDIADKILNNMMRPGKRTSLHYALSCYYAALVLARGIKYGLEKDEQGKEMCERLGYFVDISGDKVADEMDNGI